MKKKNQKKKSAPKMKIIDKAGNWIATVFVIIILVSCVSYFFSDAYQSGTQDLIQTVSICVTLVLTIIGIVLYFVLSWRSSKAKRVKTVNSRK